MTQSKTAPAEIRPSHRQSARTLDAGDHQIDQESQRAERRIAEYFQ